MTEVKKILTIDLARRGNSRLVFARQHDSGSRCIIIKLTNGGFPYIVTKDIVSTVNFLRSDGESTAFSADVLDDGNISIVLPNWALLVAGEVKCSVSLYGGDKKKLTSADFILDVEEALYDGDDVSQDSNYSLLTSLMADMAEINDAEELRAEAERSRVVAEASRVENENIRIEAEIVRASEEDVRINAEILRNLAEKERQEKENSRISAENLRKEAEEHRNNAISEQNTRISAAYGKSGYLMLDLAEWSSDISISREIEGIGENDLITFYPSSISDRDIINECEMFIEPQTDGVVTFTAKTVPASAISMCYFICRGIA